MNAKSKKQSVQNMHVHLGSEDMRQKQLQLDINEYYYNYEYYSRNNNENTNAQYLKCLKACLKIAMEKEITPYQKEVLEDYYYQEKKMSEIAEKKGVNISTISRQIRRAKEIIRGKLEYFEAIYKICKRE